MFLALLRSLFSDADWANWLLLSKEEELTTKISQFSVQPLSRWVDFILVLADIRGGKEC